MSDPRLIADHVDHVIAQIDHQLGHWSGAASKVAELSRLWSGNGSPAYASCGYGKSGSDPGVEAMDAANKTMAAASQEIASLMGQLGGLHQNTAAALEMCQHNAGVLTKYRPNLHTREARNHYQHAESKTREDFRTCETIMAVIAATQERVARILGPGVQLPVAMHQRLDNLVEGAGTGASAKSYGAGSVLEDTIYRVDRGRRGATLYGLDPLEIAPYLGIRGPSRGYTGLDRLIQGEEYRNRSSSPRFNIRLPDCARQLLYSTPTPSDQRGRYAVANASSMMVGKPHLVWEESHTW